MPHARAYLLANPAPDTLSLGSPSVYPFAPPPTDKPPQLHASGARAGSNLKVCVRVCGRHAAGSRAVAVLFGRVCVGGALAARRSRALPVNVVGSWSVAVGVERVVAVGVASFSFVNFRALGGK